MDYVPTSNEMLFHDDEDFLDHVVFSDELTFHLSGHVNTHNVHVWGSENLHEMVQMQHDSSKVTVFCAVSRRKVYGPFFFGEPTVTGTSYLYTLEQWIFPHLEEDEPENLIFQQDGAPPHWHSEVRNWLNFTLPKCWTGRKEPNDKVCFVWPPCSPNLMPCDFYLWGFIKDHVHVALLPADLPELRNRIEAAVATITGDTLINIWKELNYRLDVCRVTNGAHIEHL